MSSFLKPKMQLGKVSVSHRNSSEVHLYGPELLERPQSHPKTAQPSCVKDGPMLRICVHVFALPEFHGSHLFVEDKKVIQGDMTSTSMIPRSVSVVLDSKVHRLSQ